MRIPRPQATVAVLSCDYGANAYSILLGPSESPAVPTAAGTCGVLQVATRESQQQGATQGAENA